MKKILRPLKQATGKTSYQIGWLLLVALTIAFLLQVKNGFFQLTQSYPRSIVTSAPSGALIKGTVLRGRFRSAYANLGIMAVRFDTSGRSNDDTLLFRIKQHGNEQWYYKNQYRADQMLDEQFFPFGFSLINNSSGNVYDFELQSLRGRKGEALKLPQEEPFAVAIYQYSPSFLVFHPDQAIIFLIAKLLNSFSGIMNIILIVSPFLIYALLRFLVFGHLRRWGIILVILATCSYIFALGKILPGESTDSAAVMIFVLALWIVPVVIWKIRYTIWFILATTSYLVVILVLLTFKRPDIADRAATLAVYCLTLGTLQALCEYFWRWRTRPATVFLDVLLPQKIRSSRHLRKMFHMK